MGTQGRGDTGTDMGTETRGHTHRDRQTQGHRHTDTGTDRHRGTQTRGQTDTWGQTDKGTDGHVSPPPPQVRQVRLFQDEQIYSDLYLTVCEWPSDSSKLIVFGFK